MKKNKNFNKVYFFSIIFVIISFSSYLFWKYDTFLDYNKQIKELEAQILIAEELNEELTNQTEYKNSNEYIEKLAREKLGMLRSNEIIFFDKE